MSVSLVFALPGHSLKTQFDSKARPQVPTPCPRVVTYTAMQVPILCSSWHILSGINPVLHMVFTFMQMYFLFMHSRLNINKNKIFAKFGLMHMLVSLFRGFT